MNLILHLYLAYTQFILGLYPVLRTFLYSCTGILILVVVMLLILLLIINTEKLNLHAHDQFKLRIKIQLSVCLVVQSSYCELSVVSLNSLYSVEFSMLPSVIHFFTQIGGILSTCSPNSRGLAKVF